MLLLLRTLSWLPLNILYLLSDLLYVLVYKVIRYRKKVVRSNLSMAFPERSSEELLVIEKEFYVNFCDFIVESIKGLSINPDNISGRVTFINLDEIRQVFTQHGSVLMLAGHQFNWEWMQLSASLQFPVTIDYIYQPLKNKASDNLMLYLRGRFGAKPVKRREAARQILKNRNEAKGIALVADQLPTRRDKLIWLTFFNKKTAFFESIEPLSRLANIPVAYFNIEKISRGRYMVKMTILSMAPNEEKPGMLLRKYASLLEENIRKQPHNWLWTHKRWKVRD